MCSRKFTLLSPATVESMAFAEQIAVCNEKGNENEKYWVNSMAHLIWLWRMFLYSVFSTAIWKQWQGVTSRLCSVIVSHCHLTFVTRRHLYAWSDEGNRFAVSSRSSLQLNKQGQDSHTSISHQNIMDLADLTALH